MEIDAASRLILHESQLHHSMAPTFEVLIEAASADTRQFQVTTSSIAKCVGPNSCKIQERSQPQGPRTLETPLEGTHSHLPAGKRRPTGHIEDGPPPGPICSAQLCKAPMELPRFPRSRGAHTTQVTLAERRDIENTSPKPPTWPHARRAAQLLAHIP